MKTTLILAFLVLSVSASVGQPLCDFMGKDSLVVEIVGDTVKIWDLLACGNCASAFVTSVDTSGDSLYIMQTDTGQFPATCDCMFNLRASVVGLPAGMYTAVIYRDWHVKFPYLTEPVFIGSIQFQINPVATPMLSVSGFQSPCLPTSVPTEDPGLPEQFALLPNYPNPFNPSTTVPFQVSETQFVVIKVFDVLGREVQTLLSQLKSPGLHSVVFEARPELCSGIYCCRMTAGSFTRARSMVLLR